MEPLRHVGTPGFGAVVFRRVSPELTGPGSLWELATETYPIFGADMRENPYLIAKFPSGATVQFTHLQHVSDVYTHHGKQYCLVCFDEVQRFEAFQVWYLISRMRSTCGVRPYLRATCNPDPDSFVRDLIDWWIDDNGYPIDERMGVLRWFVRKSGELNWADTREELEEQFPGSEPLSFTFIGATLDDNQALVKADPGYRAKLEALPEIERARLLGGNWNVRPTGGKYIPATCFEKRWVDNEGREHLGTGEIIQTSDIIIQLPSRLYVYMSSDFAVTEPENPDDDPDYTEHGVFGLCEDGNIWVLDWWYRQTTSDVWIDSLLDLWAKWKPLAWFGEGGVIRRAVEPSLRRRMKERRIYARIEWLNPQGRSVAQGTSKEGYADRSKQAKAIRGRPLQALAHQGKIIMPARAPWVSHVVETIVNFPAKGHDDSLDTASLFASALDTHHPAVIMADDDETRDRDYTRGSGSGSWRTP